MNKKRTISIRHPQLIKFRNTLREVISTAEDVELGKLLDEGKGLKPTESDADGKRVRDISDKWQKLETAWKKSLCTCSLCGSRSSNMTFNTHFKAWFCVTCYKEHQKFYDTKAREGEIWNAEDVYRTPSTEWWP